MKKTKQKKPRVLIFDIETSEMHVKTWGIYNQFLRPDQIVRPWNIISVAAKFLGEKKIYQLDLSKSKNYRNDKSLTKYLMGLIKQADYIITQNGVKFDLPRVLARSVINNHAPVKIQKLPKHIDVYRLAKPFGFVSRSLDALAEFFGVKLRKLPKKPGLWDDCEAGDKKAWKTMAKYNIRDVVLLEQVYNKIKLWTDDGKIHKSCKKCGTNKWTKYGFAYKEGNKFQKLKCGGCGHGEKVKVC